MNSKFLREQLRSLNHEGKLRKPERYRRQLAKRGLIPFTQWTFPDYRARWHHRLVAEKLEALQRGDIKRLIINMPPRHGKSELMSRRFPAYCLGLDPDEQIIACSYNENTAKGFNRDVQRIIMTREYKEVFPGTLLSERNVVTTAHRRELRNATVFEVVSARGCYRSSGVGGGITGQGSTIGLIDDPFKNHEEAFSLVYRQRVWDWYTSTFLLRGEGAFVRGGDVRIAISVTRWHEDDLVGRLLETMKASDDEEWEVVNLPAILDSDPIQGDPRDEGEALWPEKYSTAKLGKLKRLIGPIDWNSLYQQRPQAAEGGMFKRNWWKRYTPTDLPRIPYIWTSWDLAVKGTPATKKNKRSYNVGLVLGKLGGKFYVLDCVRFQGDFVQQIVMFKGLVAKWPAAMAHVVEAKANGPALIASLREHIPGIMPWEPDHSARQPGDRRMGATGKEARAAAITPLVATGSVYLPEGAPWVDAFVDECAGFPSGKYDDQVDAVVQGLQYGHRSAISIYENLQVG